MVGVSPYPVAWRVEVVDDEKHRGFEYIRSVLLDAARRDRTVHRHDAKASVG